MVNLFDEHRTQINELNKKNLQEVDRMLVTKRKETQKRFKEYDGTYYGRYVRWGFLVFFYFGAFAVISLIGVWIAKENDWL